jgi:hypothetical protein
VKFPIGGKVREPSGRIWCNSKTDSIVWMGEDMVFYALFFAFICPEKGIFCYIRRV